MGDVNLIPAERRVRRHRKARLYVWTTVCGTYILLLVVGSLTLRAFGSSEGRSFSGRLEAVTEQAEQSNREMLELRRELAEATVALETTRAIHDQPDWSKLFVGLSDQLGGDIVLSRCQLATLTKEDEAITDGLRGRLPAKPLSVFLAECRHKLVLNGFGETQEAVSQFVLRLESIGAFDMVRLTNSSRQSFLRGEAVAFSIECDF